MKKEELLESLKTMTKEQLSVKYTELFGKVLSDSVVKKTKKTMLIAMVAGELGKNSKANSTVENKNIKKENDNMKNQNVKEEVQEKVEDKKATSKTTEENTNKKTTPAAEDKKVIDVIKVIKHNIAIQLNRRSFTREQIIKGVNMYDTTIGFLDYSQSTDEELKAMVADDNYDVDKMKLDRRGMICCLMNYTINNATVLISKKLREEKKQNAKAMVVYIKDNKMVYRVLGYMLSKNKSKLYVVKDMDGNKKGLGYHYIHKYCKRIHVAEAAAIFNSYTAFKNTLDKSDDKKPTVEDKKQENKADDMSKVGKDLEVKDPKKLTDIQEEDEKDDMSSVEL